MNYIDRKEPDGSLSKALQQIMPQMVGTIAQQMNQRRQQQANALGLKSLFPNVYPSQLQAMSMMSPDILKQLLPEHGMTAIGQNANVPEQHEQAILDQTGLTQQQPVNNRQQVDPMSQLLKSIQGTPASMLAQNQLNQPELDMQAPETQASVEPKIKGARNSRAGKAPGEYMTFGEALAQSGKPMNEYQRAQTALKEQALKQRAEETKAIRGEHKENASKKFREEIGAQEKAAIDSDMRLGRLYTLAKKGELVNPVLYSGLQKIGLDIPGLMNPDTQEFDELVTNFLRDAKSIFGSRVTNYEMSTFIKSIPSLKNTNEGKMRIIRNLKLYNAASKLRAKTMQDIMEENGGEAPLYLQEKVSKKIKPQLDKISKMFAGG